MAGSLVEEEIHRQVREQLNKEKVKLWLPPYTTEDVGKGEQPKELITRYAQELSLSEETVTNAIEHLRLHALEKLAARQKLQESGLATFKIKLAGNVPTELNLDKNSPPKKTKTEGRPYVLTLEFDINRVGWDLKQCISNASGIDVLRLKLITAGTVIDDHIPLKDQNVNFKSGQIMAICMSETEAEARRHQDEMDRVSKTREAAELLSAKEDGGDNDNANYYLRIADQTGKPLDLPPAERKALTLALTLNEKGRAALRRKEYGEALLLLLEADKEFSNCRASILEAVDNFAILCLDIVWCYLCLKNINDLPDAERRLKACDDCFRKSYGPNLERLALIKGGTGTEKALFMRLHLLQGIVSFHQGQRDKAKLLLARAESELKSLQINEDSMTQVMAMGFTSLEARLALRACDGNVTLAISHIVKKKEEKQKRKEREKEEKRRKKLEKKLGETANGSWVNIEMYGQLVSMGFPKGASAQALRQSNNDISMSLKILEECPDLLTLPDPDTEEVNITDDMLAQVTALGFPIEAARAVLHKYRANIESAVEELLKRGGSVPQEWIDAAFASSSSDSSSGSSFGSSSGSGGSSSESSSPTKSPEEVQKEKETINRIVEDLPEDEEEHLDLTLDEEAQFLSEYSTLLESLT